MGRFLPIRQRQALIGVDCETVKNVVLRAPIDKIRIRNGRLIANSFRPGARVVERECDELLRLVKRQRPQHYGIDHAEDCGIGANPESKGKDNDESERRLFRQHSQRISQILQQHDRGLIQNGKFV